MSTTEPAAATAVAEAYYDSEDADTFYREIWGGEDIHIGLYQPGDSIAAASRRTVAAMAGRLAGLGPGCRVLDLGAGYGGAARWLADTHGAQVTCLNLSEVENARNRLLTAEAGLAEKVRVVHGAFEAIPEPDGAFDVVWSQDAFLHSPDRRRTLSEAVRVLRPGGELIFTDPMQSEAVADPAVLQPIYDRIHLDSLASIGLYRETLTALGLEEVGIEEMGEQLVIHYGRVRDEVLARRGELAGRISADYIERMVEGLEHWVRAGGEGLLAWGILHFRKPG